MDAGGSRCSEYVGRSILRCIGYASVLPCIYASLIEDIKA